MSTEDSESTDKTEHAQSTENAEAAGPVGRGRTADTPGRVALTRSERLRSQGSRGEAGRPFLRGLLTLIVVLAIIAIVRTLFVQSYTIPSGSMEDTLHAGDRILVTLYDTDSVQHGDVVVFTDPDHWLTDPEPTGAARFAQDVLVILRILPQDAGHHLVKRVVGLPGDHIVADGSGPVSVNGVVLDEPYLKPGRTSSDIAFDVTVPDGYVWVMGDNRSNSADSRLHQGDAHGGFVPAEDIVGIARFVYWPIGRWSGLVGGRDVFSQVPQAASVPTVVPAPTAGEG